VDLHVPAGDVDLLDNQAEQVLFLIKIEVVDGGHDPVGEVTDAAAELIVAGELVAFGGQGVAAVGEMVSAGVDVSGAALEFGQLDQTGLVEVGQPAPFGVDGLLFAVQACQLGRQQFVVGGGNVDGDGLFAGQ
jgi:hypothetical protein